MKKLSILSIGLVAVMLRIAPAQTVMFPVAGVSRNFILYAPSGLGINPPLVFVIHGFNMTGQQEVGLTRMNAVADREKFLVVYPNALPNTSNQASWDLSGPNDYAFLLAIADTVDGRYRIDRNRVYASGFSQGGFMSFQLGCRYADKFAAIAPVSGLLQGNCAPARPVPLISIFGTQDAATPAQFMANINTWVQLNNCPASPVVTRPYPSTNPNSVVTQLKYGPCRNGTEVIADSVQGGPHEWPMTTQTKINSSEEIWAFFKRFSLNSTALDPRFPGMAAEVVSAFYTNGFVRLRGVEENARVQVFDSRGNRIQNTLLHHAQFAFKSRTGGVYEIRVFGKSRRVSLKIAVP